MVGICLVCISNLTFSLKLRRWQFSTLGFEVLKSAPRKKVVFYFCTKTADLACVWAGGRGRGRVSRWCRGGHVSMSGQGRGLAAGQNSPASVCQGCDDMMLGGSSSIL